MRNESLEGSKERGLSVASDTCVEKKRRIFAMPAERHSRVMSERRQAGFAAGVGCVLMQGWIEAKWGSHHVKVG